MTREDKIKLFVNELNYIKNQNFKKFAEELIGSADDYFFVVPASSSGKYHPSFSLGEGGLVRHTRCVAYFAQAMAESLNLSQEDSDLLIIAALAHDIKKQGDNTGHTVREHPLLASTYICEIMNKFSEDIITNEQVQKICGAVVSHMGKWEHLPEYTRGKEAYPMPNNDFEKALQAADYIASRKAILEFDFAPTENVVLPVNEVKTNNKREVNTYTLEELHNFIVPFGQNKGKTFKEVKDNGYLFWMTSQEVFNAVDIQSLAKRYLLLLGEKCGAYPINVTLNTENSDNKEILNSDDLPF